MAEVRYVPKEEIAPKLGFWNAQTREITIRADIPRCAQKFLLAHEQHHDENTETDESWLEEELEANLSWKSLLHPLGALWVIGYTLCSKERWQYYLERIKKGEKCPTA